MFLISYGFELDEDTITDASYELEGLEGIVKFSSKWLLQQLIVQLHEHMSYKCVHKKFGTILYNKRGDLLKSLSWALGSKGSTSTAVVSRSQTTPSVPPGGSGGLPYSYLFKGYPRPGVVRIDRQKTFRMNNNDNG